MGRLKKNLEQWLDHQEISHHQEIDLGLNRVKKVYKKLFPTALNFKTIIVAGTNGKGSTIAFLESIYFQAGYNIAKFTSPHLLTYNERICINQNNVNDAQICQAFEDIEQARADISLTYFEFSILAALLIFRQQKVDIALLEVGIGGRLDAVNIVDANCGVITSIDLDHTDYLGDTRELIAIEKMGIMRDGIPMLSAEQQPPTTMLNKNIEFITKPYLGKLSLLGEHQKLNASLALATVNKLDLFVSDSDKKIALANTKVLARQQVIIYKNKSFIVDVAHNPASVAALVNTLKSRNKKTVAIFSALKDKNIGAMIDKIGPFVEQWFLIPLDSNRSLNILKLQDFFTDKTTICQNATDAIDKILKIEITQVVVFGSFLTVAEVLEVIK